MARVTRTSRCSACGHEEPRWVGRCPACETWGSMSEERAAEGRAASGRRSPSRRDVTPAQPIATIPMDEVERLPTAVGELDRVLGGGLVPGVVALVGGEPGIGKSTMLLQAAQGLAEGGSDVLYVSGEESVGQLRIRAERLGALHRRVLAAAETQLPDVLGLLERHAPDVLVLDSIQTVADPALGSSPGAVVQVRECAGALARHAKRHGTATVLVGHVTKDGAIAGPRTLEHLVDAVITFEGEHDGALRLLRAVKNRYGATGEVGCFEMTGDGLREVPDAGRLFRSALTDRVSGIAATVTLEGPRPLAVEVQALVARSSLTVPRRQASGLDASRLNLLVAVLERRADLPFDGRDLFASAVGGVRLREPAADLAVALAIASGHDDVPLPSSLVALGEVGLAGEVRPVPRTGRRLEEAARLGFDTAICPAGYDGDGHGLRVLRVGHLVEAVTAAFRLAGDLREVG